MRLLITSAVNVDAPLTKLLDPSTRLSLTLTALARWRSMPSIESITICDGSGFVFPKDAIPIQGPPCEFLSFQNDKEGVRRWGKGFGEGEIIKFALERSEFLSEAQCFAKCTSKLWVANFDRCLRNFNGEAAFDTYGRWAPQAVDTRFYMVGMAFFRRHLIEEYRKVDDTTGFYLEHAYARVLQGMRFKEYLMTPTPRVMGVSGSSSNPYENSAVRSRLRDARNVILRRLPL